ncbi:MAG: PP2C family serine/threonine-protein phosphatase [Thiotrichaceae bacterium]|nr:PP2C family serine/threonine-protein phosphatase [Thiotrichaceae bacterium]
MRWTIVGVNKQGTREEQEDSFIILPKCDDNHQIKNEYLLVIGDGMGGQENGKLASNELIKVAKHIWESEQVNPTLLPQDLINTIINQAHNNIKKLREQFQSNMGTTCVVLYVHNMQAWWAHVGDSRLYFIRDDKVLAQTVDHSVVQMLVSMGRISETEMRHHADRGRLLKNLGSKGEIDAEHGQVKLRAGDSFVLCTDGFWEYIPIRPLIFALKKYSVKKIANILARKAIEKGGNDSDNTTVIIAKSDIKQTSSLLDYILLSSLFLFILYLIYISLSL